MQKEDNVSRIPYSNFVSVSINTISAENSKLFNIMPATQIVYFSVAVKWVKRSDFISASKQSIHRLNTSGLASQT